MQSNQNLQLSLQNIVQEKVQYLLYHLNVVSRSIMQQKRKGKYVKHNYLRTALKYSTLLHSTNEKRSPPPHEFYLWIFIYIVLTIFILYKPGSKCEM